MANRRLSKTFLSISVLSATSEASSFPRANIVDRTSPQRAWRSTGIGSDHRVVIDLGATQTDITCYLDWVNFSSFKYQESANGTSGWADIGSLRTVEPDDITGVYRRVDNITLSGKRYLGIYVPAQSTTDGESYFRIGTFCVPVSIVELDAGTDISYPFEVAVLDSNIIVNQFPTGRNEKVKLGTLQPMIISFTVLTTVMQNLSGDRVREITDLFRDSTQTIFIDFNLSNTWQAYLCKKSGELRASINAPHTGTGDFGTMIFEVVI